MKRKKEMNLGVVVMLICFVYWAMIFFTTRMDLNTDASVYNTIGHTFAKEGWKGYLGGGLNREPLYPMMIAFSVKLAFLFDIDYFIVQKIAQILFLFITWLLLWHVLNQLKIDRRIKAGILLYFGLSPAVINATFSMFSEIAGFPFVLLGVILLVDSYRTVSVETRGRIIFLGLLTALIFIAASCVKAVFQYIVPFVLLPFIFLALKGLFTKQGALFKKNMLYVIAVILGFSVFVFGYRALNWHYNGKFDYSNRYDYALYGNIAKRVEKLDRKAILAHIAAVPGERFCHKFFDRGTCDFATFLGADYYRWNILPKLLGDTSELERETKTIEIAFKEFPKNPKQFIFLTFLESFKMAFWESTQIGFVHYPPILSKIYSNAFVKNGMRLASAIATYCGLIYCLFLLVRGGKGATGEEETRVLRRQYLMFIFLILVPFTGLYALFSILIRFAFPIISLYLICIAIFLQRIFEKRSAQR